MTTGAPPEASAAARPDSVQQGLDALVRADGLPAALAGVKDREGHTRNYTAGVADVTTRAKVPVDGQVRIGSNTKTFTAVVVLQHGAGYGLGLMSRPLSCGGVYWGHGGDIPGYETRGGATDYGRAVSVEVTEIPPDAEVAGRVEKVVDAALCRR
ncbi:serine hydrolase [Streptomyces sp. NBC_00212]|uniref:serine hydrolase n=1 Tax=Streptomyces sp. NBC_00212 TaxID=2975684 RepID=UPI00386B569E